MADISSSMAHFLAAAFGEEVRMDIVNMFNAINTQSGNSANTLTRKADGLYIDENGYLYLLSGSKKITEGYGPVSIREDWVKLAESFTHGQTGFRIGEDTDNAQYYYEGSKNNHAELEGYVLQAGVSATSASLSASEAAKSEANAKASETASGASERNAKLSEENARTSETNSKASENSALNAQQEASRSESAAKLSEISAADSESNSKNYHDQTALWYGDIEEWYSDLKDRKHFEWRGSWSSGSDYWINNMVEYDGSCFIALVDRPSLRPQNDGVNWALVASGYSTDQTPDRYYETTLKTGSWKSNQYRIDMENLQETDRIDVFAPSRPDKALKKEYTKLNAVIVSNGCFFIEADEEPQEDLPIRYVFHRN